MLKMPKGANCLLWSLAYLLQEKPSSLMRELGHNGMEHTWDAPPPFDQIGFHLQEMNDLCLRRGRVLVEIECFPRSVPVGDYEPVAVFEDEEGRFESIISGRPGIFCTQTHAMAWDGFKVFDPNGRVLDIDAISFREFWLLLNITSVIDVMSLL